MELLKDFQLALKSFRLQQNPRRTDLIFDLVDIASSLKRNEKFFEEMERTLLKSQGFKEMWEEKWNPEPLTFEKLALFSEGTLGHAYLIHLKQNGLQPDFYRKPKIQRVINYLSYRLYCIHDIWHALLGYDTSIAGELEVQAFTAAQLRTPISVFLITGGLYNLLRTNPQKTIEAFERVNSAFNRGKRSTFLLDLRLEDRLDESLVELRQKLMVQ